MYAEFFNLTDEPFQLNPDHRFFYPSSVHSRAKSYLSYGLQQGEGFTIITGDVGAGKTTLIGLLLAALDKNSFSVGNIVTTYLYGDDTLRMIASVFGVPYEGCEKPVILDRLSEHFITQLEQGKRNLLIVDEAQNLSFEGLEELRMLSNFQYNGKAMLQCCLLGQPQFRVNLAHSDLEQFRQRVIASFHLSGMNAEETILYIKHRLSTVKWRGDPSFTDEGFEEIFARTGGIPRKINRLCSRLFLYCSLEEKHEISKEIVRSVADDLEQEIENVDKTPGSSEAGTSSPKAIAAEANGGRQLPMEASNGRGSLPRPGKFNSELEELQHRIAHLESREKLTTQEKDKIILFIANHLKSLSENLGVLKE